MVSEYTASSFAAGIELGFAQCAGHEGSAGSGVASASARRHARAQARTLTRGYPLVVRLLGAIALFTLGCAGSSGAEAPDALAPDDAAPSLRSSDDPARLDAALKRSDGTQRHASSSRRLSPQPIPRTVRIVSPEPQPARVGLQRAVSVEFHDAELGNALRLLSIAGDFNLVVEGKLSGRVSIRLDDVTPYDALVAIADAKGVLVTRRADVVVVRGP